MDLTPDEIELIQGRRAQADAGEDAVIAVDEFVAAEGWTEDTTEPANEPPFPQGGEKLSPESYGEPAEA